MTSHFRQPARERAEVVVLGGGIVGAAAARELSRHGADVILVDPAGPAAGSSGRCDGNVLVQTKHDDLGVRLTLRSIEGYRRWAAEAEADRADGDGDADGGGDGNAGGIGFHQNGSLVFFTEPDSDLDAPHRVERLRAAGARADHIGGAELRRREPGLRDGLAGAIDCYDDASVYPPGVVAALVRDACRHGCRTRWGVRALGLLTGAGGRVTGVRTDRGDIAAPHVVNAMGVWSPSLDTGGRVPLPVRPRQGVLVVTEEAPGLVRRTVTEAVYMTNRAGAGDGTRAAIAFVAEPTLRGNILLGSSRRFCGPDTGVDQDVFAAIVTRAVGFMPALAGVRVIRSFAGLRPWTPDNRPIVGPAPEVPGYVLATGHEGEGVGLAPVTAELVAASVLGLPVPALLGEALAAFAPGRPGVSAAAEEVS